MSSDCPICGILFQNREELADHVQFYQCKIGNILVRMQAIAGQQSLVEFTSLLHFLQDLVLHHDIPSDDNSTDSTVGIHAQTLPALTNHKKKQQHSLKCPHEKCHGKSQRFSRNLDLERHYSLHVELEKRTCEVCKSPFPQANDCLLHNCASDDKLQQRRIREQRKKMREDIREKILLKRRTLESDHDRNHRGKKNRHNIQTDSLANSPSRQPAPEVGEQSEMTRSAAMLQDSYGLIWSAPGSSCHPTIQDNNSLVYTDPLAAIYNSMTTTGNQTALAQHPFSAGVYSQFKLPDQSGSGGQFVHSSAGIFDQI